MFIGPIFVHTHLVWCLAQLPNQLFVQLVDILSLWRAFSGQGDASVAHFVALCQKPFKDLHKGQAQHA